MNPLTLTPSQAREKIAMLKGYKWCIHKTEKKAILDSPGEAPPSIIAAWKRVEALPRGYKNCTPERVMPIDWLSYPAAAISLYAELCVECWGPVIDADVVDAPESTTIVRLYRAQEE